MKEIHYISNKLKLALEDVEKYLGHSYSHHIDTNLFNNHFLKKGKNEITVEASNMFNPDVLLKLQLNKLKMQNKKGYLFTPRKVEEEEEEGDEDEDEYGTDATNSERRKQNHAIFSLHMREEKSTGGLHICISIYMLMCVRVRVYISTLFRITLFLIWYSPHRLRRYAVIR